jgi:phenylacetate-coenzyme A ligase PaaK-like adenylate-forming protein
MNIDVLPYGPVADPVHAAHALASFGAHCLVGIPTQVLTVAESGRSLKLDMDSIKNILLSTDYVPKAIADTLQGIWGSRVFNHYGMTEMGLGGGVDCEALGGYHLREADLYFEVVDHETGKACPVGTIGEVVFTTLTRQGMPLIRYRTGDIARMISGPCPCGSILRRMEWVKGRWDSAITLSPGCTLTLSDMDEVLFRLPGLLDYRVTASQEENRKFQLHIDVHKAEESGPTAQQILQSLQALDTIQNSMSNGDLKPPTVRFSSDGHWATTGVSKRTIIINRSPV